MRISDWSSDVCSSDLAPALPDGAASGGQLHHLQGPAAHRRRPEVAARRAWRPDLDDLPGTDDFAESAAHGGKADQRDAVPAQGHEPGPGAPAQPRAPEAGDRKSTRLNYSH